MLYFLVFVIIPLPFLILHTYPMFSLAIGNMVRLNTIEKSITCIKKWL